MKNINFKKYKANLEERSKKIPKRDDIVDDYNCPSCRDTTYILNKIKLPKKINLITD